MSTDETGTRHWPHGPSSAQRVFECPGSVTLGKGLESPPSDYAMEGTEAAELARKTLVEDSTAVVEYADTNREMAEHIEGYVSWIEDSVRCHDPAREWVEETLESSLIPNCGGTPDYAAVYSEGDDILCHIVELKYGKGIPVSAATYHPNGELHYVNRQLMVQACLLLEQVPAISLFYLTVYQPRVGGEPDETVEVTSEDVIAFRTEYIERIETHDNLSVGSHCQFCPAIHLCPEMERSALEIARETFKPVITEDTRRRWREFLGKESAIRKAFEAIKERVIAEIESGVEYEGWTTQAKRGNRRWIADESDIIKALGKLRIGKRIATEPKLKSPTQLDKEGYWEEIKHLVERPEGAPKLVQKNPRKPVDHKLVVEMFDDVSIDDIF